MGDKQNSLGRGREYVDQIFALRTVSKEYSEIIKGLIIDFMDQWKAHNMMN